MDQVQGFKRFIITLLSLIFLSFITLVLLYCMIIKITNPAETLPIISVAVMGIGSIAGVYLGAQSLTDYFKNKNNKPGAVQPVPGQ